MAYAIDRSLNGSGGASQQTGARKGDRFVSKIRRSPRGRAVRNLVRGLRSCRVWTVVAASVVAGLVGFQACSADSTTISSVVGPPGAVYVGEAGTITVTVSNTSGSSDPTGNVVFSISSGSGSFSPSDTVPLDTGTAGDGTSTCSVDYVPDSGVTTPHTITAGYGGNGGFDPAGNSPQSVDVAVQKNNAAIGPVLVVPTEVFVGEPATLTITVTNTTSAMDPTGNVVVSVNPGLGSFSPSGTVALTGNLDGTSTATVTYTPDECPPTTHEFTVAYPGNNAFHPVDPPATATLEVRRETVTTVFGSETPLIVNNPAVFLVTVIDLSPVDTVPIGTVSFSWNPALGTVNPASCPLDEVGQCTFTYTPIEGESAAHTISAAYDGGDGVHATSSGSYAQAIVKRAADVRLSCTPVIAYIDQPITCEVEVVDDTTEGIPALVTGAVTFSDGGKNGSFLVGAVPLVDGRCSVTYTPAAWDEGVTTLTATYNGSPVHATQDASQQVSIELRPTETTVTCKMTKLLVNEAYPCTVSVVDKAGVGTASAFKGTLDVSTSLPEGEATVNTVPLSAYPTPTFDEAASGEPPGLAFQYMRLALDDDAGSDTIRVDYTPTDGVHAASAGAFIQPLQRRPTAVTLNCVATPTGCSCSALVEEKESDGGIPPGFPALIVGKLTRMAPKNPDDPSEGIVEEDIAGCGSLSGFAPTCSFDVATDLLLANVTVHYTPTDNVHLKSIGSTNPPVNRSAFIPVTPGDGTTGALCTDGCGSGGTDVNAMIRVINAEATYLTALQMGLEVVSIAQSVWPDPIIGAGVVVISGTKIPVKDIILAVLSGSKLALEIAKVAMTTDIDGDGLYDVIERHTTHTDTLFRDTDGDGLPDPDEIAAAGGYVGGSRRPNPDDPDSDDDGLMDGYEWVTYQTDFCLLDTDCDGLSDGYETASYLAPSTEGFNRGHGDYPEDTFAALSHVSAVGVANFPFGTVDQLNPLEQDTDGDGLPDSDEWYPGCGRDPTDGLANVSDSDGDGLIDSLDTDPDLPGASDNDGELNDDTAHSICDPDSDGDGLLDGEEVQLGTDRLDWDSDDDGLSDYEELKVYFTNPNDPDSDGDSAVGVLSHRPTSIPLPGNNPSMGTRMLHVEGVDIVAFDVVLGSDGVEAISRTGVFPFGALGDQSDPLQMDTDGDGLQDNLEFVPGCNCGASGSGSVDGYVNNADSDSDGLNDLDDSAQLVPPGPDGLPRAPGSDVALAYANEGELEPDGEDLICAICDPDSDGDGLPDGFEVAVGTSSVDWDTDNDGLSDAEELLIYGTDAHDTDSDNDLAGEDVGDDKGFFEGRVPSSGLQLPGHPALECTSYQGMDRVYAEGPGCIRCMSDCEEVLSHAGVWPFQSLRDQSDPLNPDTDADGLRDDDEFPPGCNGGKDGYVNDGDSDDDSLQDGADAALSLFDVLGAGADFVVGGVPYSIPANDGELHDDDLCSICDTDSDGDGLSDGEELHLGIDALDWDTDDDGLSDREELEFFSTDPFLFDTDGDKAGSPSAGEGINLIDARNPDIGPTLLGYGGFRGIGCESDCEEILSRGTHPPFVGDPRDQTDPLQVDTDGDGLEDWKEFYPGCGNLASPTPLADGYANSFDSDSDGLPDGEEINNSLGGADVGEAGVGMALGNDGELSNSPPGTQDLICSMCDPDSDDDGLKDGEEDYGVEQHLDWDYDDDGLSDREEAEVFFTDSFVQDTDGDGANGNIGCRTATETPTLSGYTGTACIDCRSDCEEALSGSNQGLFHGDTLDRTDPLIPDTDGDGLTDDLEFPPGCGCRLAHEHVPEGVEEFREVGSNICDGYAASFDSDNDGRRDGDDVYEDLPFAWVPFPGEVRTTVIPGTGDLEEQEKDLYELPEVGAPPADANCFAPCSICDPDSDGDGLSDGEERDIGASWLDWDTDDDGGNDGLELTGGGPIPTDPFDPDTDDDGLLDSAEVLGPNPTNPVNADTDGDGLCDGGGPTFTPSGTGTNPLCSCTTPPCESVGEIVDHPNPNGLGEDASGDGSWDAGETDPNQYDTDGDAVGDGVEKLGFSTSRQSWIPATDLFGRAITVTYPACGCSDPLDPDTDDDGLEDGVEDLNHDGNFDFLVSDFDYEDPIPGPTRPEPEETNPCDPDTDDDGLIDYDERYQPNPPSFYPFNPTNPLDHDTDNDWLTDGVEVNWVCVDPGYNLDPDNDGIDDYVVMTVIDDVLDPTNRDSDSDRFIDGLDSNPCYSFLIPILGPPETPPVDSDEDGFSDEDELAAGTDPNDADSHPIAFTADLDRNGDENDRLWLEDPNTDSAADSVAFDLGSDVLVDARVELVMMRGVETGDFDGDGAEDDTRYTVVYAFANYQFLQPRIELVVTDLNSDLTIDELVFGES
jgi:hypothetical protein